MEAMRAKQGRSHSKHACRDAPPFSTSASRLHITLAGTHLGLAHRCAFFREDARRCDENRQPSVCEKKRGRGVGAPGWRAARTQGGMRERVGACAKRGRTSRTREWRSESKTTHRPSHCVEKKKKCGPRTAPPRREKKKACACLPHSIALRQPCTNRARPACCTHKKKKTHADPRCARRRPRPAGPAARRRAAHAD